MIVDVELFYYLSEEPEGAGIWAAEWAPRGAYAATEDEETDLAALVRSIVEDLLPESPVSLNWIFEEGGGDLSPTETKRLVAETGVTLPSRLWVAREDRSAAKRAPDRSGRRAAPALDG